MSRMQTVLIVLIVGIVQACVVYAQQPPPSRTEVTGQYTGTTAGKSTAVTISIHANGTVVMEGQHADWRGVYEEKKGKLTAKRTPTVDDLPLFDDRNIPIPMWAREQAVGRLVWETTLTASRAPILTAYNDSSSSIVMLEGEIDIGKITYDGTKGTIAILPSFVSVRLFLHSSVPCHQYPGLVAWTQFVEAGRAATDATKTAKRKKKAFDDLDETFQAWRRDHGDVADLTIVSEYNAANKAKDEWDNAKEIADHLSQDANDLQKKVLIRGRQASRNTCELCTIATVVSTLSAKDVSEADVVARASSPLAPVPFDPAKGTDDRTALWLLKDQYGFTHAQKKNLGNQNAFALKDYVACGPVLLSIQPPLQNTGHSVVIYSVGLESGEVVVKGWDPSDGRLFEWGESELRSNRWDGHALSANSPIE